MKIKITYLDKDITQELLVIDQALYDNVRNAENIVTSYAKLSETTSLELMTTLKEHGWILDMHKSGKICTTESDIFKAYKEGKGILKHMGREYPVHITEID